MEKGGKKFGGRKMNKEKYPKKINTLYWNGVILFFQLMGFLFTILYFKTKNGPAIFAVFILAIFFLFLGYKLYKEFFIGTGWIRYVFFVVIALALLIDVAWVYFEEFSFMLLFFVIVAIWSLVLLTTNDDVIKHFKRGERKNEN
jgi:hypothetical protein